MIDNGGINKNKAKVFNSTARDCRMMLEQGTFESDEKFEERVNECANSAIEMANEYSDIYAW